MIFGVGSVWSPNNLLNLYPLVTDNPRHFYYLAKTDLSTEPYDRRQTYHKTVSMHVGTSVYCSPIHSLHMGGSPIAWVNRLKYLGIYFVNKKGLCVDVSEVKRKFYASCNSVLCQRKYACESVKVTLIRSYCLPLLTYCIGSFTAFNCRSYPPIRSLLE